MLALIAGWGVVLACGAAMAAILALLTFAYLLPVGTAWVYAARVPLLALGGVFAGISAVTATWAAAYRARSPLRPYAGYAGWAFGLAAAPLLGIPSALGCMIATATAAAPSNRKGRRVRRSVAGRLLLAAAIGLFGAYMQIAIASFFGMTVTEFSLFVLRRLELG